MGKCPCGTCGTSGIIPIGDLMMPCPDCGGHGYKVIKDAKHSKDFRNLRMPFPWEYEGIQED